MVSFRPGNKGQQEQNDEEFLKIIPERFRVDNNDDDEFEEDKPSLIRRIIPKLLGLVVVVALAGGGFFAWQMFKKGGDVKPDAQLPLVKAEPQNYKSKPQQPGGMDVPNQDKMIYDRIGAKPEAAQAPVEKLLPAPEAPKEQAKAPPKIEPPAPQTAPQALVNQTPLPAAALAPPPAIIPPPPQVVPQPQPQPQTQAVAVVPPPPAPVVSAPVKPAQTPIASAASGTFMVQIASVSTPEAAEEEWRKKSAAHKDLLGNLTHDVQKADLGDKGVRYRLRFGPFADRPQAMAACEELKSRKIDCIVAVK